MSIDVSERRGAAGPLMPLPDLFHECYGLVGQTPDDLEKISAQIRGKGFFPVMSGSFESDVTVLPKSPAVMFVGHNFGSMAYVKGCQRDPSSDMKGRTCGNLLRILDEAKVPLAHCFFTNSVWGLLRTKKNTGSSPAWKSPEFVGRCRKALECQISQLRPAAIVALGVDCRRLLEKIFAECEQWRKRSFAEIDKRKLSLLSVHSNSSSVKYIACLTHPCIRTNVGRRCYKRHSGEAAEIALLKDLWQHITA